MHKLTLSQDDKDKLFKIITNQNQNEQPTKLIPTNSYNHTLTSMQPMLWEKEEFEK